MELNSTEESRSKAVIKGLPLKELRDFFTAADEKRFRGDQVFEWIYGHMVSSFDEMSTLPNYLRNKLNLYCVLNTLTLISSEQSQRTGTKKYLFKTHDDLIVESVIIPDPKRVTLCISTQVGCPLDCQFCATGVMGYKRNLTAAEIIDQFLMVSQDYGKNKITNIVYMGMGEPLLNYTNTLKTLQIFAEEKTKDISLRRITVSTAGIAPKIIELADSGLKVNLALSLHSMFEETRNKIMPINKKYSLAENLEAIKYYSRQTDTRITFEYVMLKDINDRDDDLNALIKLCKSISCKINVIPFNSISHMSPTGLSHELEPSQKFRADEFIKTLRENGIVVMVRYTQGDDIAAACGQLAYKFENKVN
jgi:23S rRNA (adenine2503-C2)-methyltransferase